MAHGEVSVVVPEVAFDRIDPEREGTFEGMKVIARPVGNGIKGTF